VAVKTNTNKGAIRLTIGGKLQSLRKKANLSQGQLAEQLNVSRQSVSKWELCESLPDIENIVKLSAVFNVTTDFLCKDEVDSDSDLPVVKATEENAKVTYRNKMLTVISVCLLSVGGFGVSVSWLLSRFMVSFKWTGNGPPEAAPYDPNQSPIYPRVEVKGDYWAFMNTYHLEILLVICSILIITGAVTLITRGRKNKLKSKL
jgi:transcriptional regulator with XRE-family HTH domain